MGKQIAKSLLTRRSGLDLPGVLCSLQARGHEEGPEFCCGGDRLAGGGPQTRLRLDPWRPPALSSLRGLRPRRI